MTRVRRHPCHFSLPFLLTHCPHLTSSNERKMEEEEFDDKDNDGKGHEGEDGR
jgi:hypothetical protein